jgi:hypothetical protein
LASNRKESNKPRRTPLRKLEAGGQLAAHEIACLVYQGLPPGEHRCETEYFDGRTEIETFRVDENGQIRDVKRWIEKPNPSQPKSAKKKKSCS